MEKRTLTVGEILDCTSCRFADYEITFDYCKEKNYYYVNPETIENKEVRNMFNWTILCLQLSGIWK